MKKIFPKTKLFLITSLLIIMLILSFAPHNGLQGVPHIFAAAATQAHSRYGKLNQNAILLDEDLNKITTLPPTFFVIITNETDFSDHYRVTYLDLVGIISRSHITRIDFQPVTLFHTNTFFTAQNDTHPVNIRRTPHSAANIITTIPHNSQAFFFGQKSGEALIQTHGDRWYFVRFLDGTTHRFGYVYSAQGAVDSIPANIIERVPDPPGNNQNGNGYQAPRENLEWIYIIALSIPAVIVVFALFSRGKKDRDFQ